MPQMSPYNWLFLNLYFSSILIMLISIIFFIKFNYPNIEPAPTTHKYLFKFKW